MNNFIILETEKNSDNEFIVRDSTRVEHLNSVLKSNKGELIRICLPDQGIGKAELLDINNTSAKLRVIELSKGEEKKIELIIGASRPPTIKKILEHGTSLGVSSFRFIGTSLSEKSYLSSKVFEEDEIKKHLLNGLSQSKIYYKLPKVSVNLSFKTETSYSKKLLLHFDSNKKLQEIDLQDGCTFAIGPERGWTEEEVETFSSDGFSKISLGSPTLRVEIATFALLGQVMMFE